MAVVFLGLLAEQHCMFSDISRYVWLCVVYVCTGWIIGHCQTCVCGWLLFIEDIQMTLWSDSRCLRRTCLCISQAVQKRQWHNHWRSQDFWLGGPVNFHLWLCLTWTTFVTVRVDKNRNWKYGTHKTERRRRDDWSAVGAEGVGWSLGRVLILLQLRGAVPLPRKFFKFLSWNSVL